MDYKDYYKILGISRDAAQDEIKKKYRKMASKYHPDKNPDDPTAEQKFKEVGEAYEVLKDPEKRKLYDQVGSDWKNYQQRPGGGAQDFDWSRYAGQQQGGQRVNVDFDDVFGAGRQGQGGSPFSSFFDTLFGGGGFQQGRGQGQTFQSGQQAPGGQDTQAFINVSLGDVIEGATKQFRINGEKVKVNIPAGIEDGKRLKLKGKGKRANAGGPKGDLYLKVKVDIPEGYEVKGKNIFQTFGLDLYTALLGGTVVVPTLVGKVKLTIPEETPNGKYFKFKGKGIPGFKNKGDRGDYFVKTNIELPENLTPKEKELFEQLAELRKN